MATPLSKKLAGAIATPAKTPLAVALERGERGELVELPGLGQAWVRLLGADDSMDVEADVKRAMEDRGLAFSELTVLMWEAERAKQTLSRAVRSSEDRTRPFGTLAEWGQVDDPLITAAWQVYGDIRERLDPVASETISESVRAQIRNAWVKKNRTLLRSFGVSELATFLVTTEFPPETSPTVTSSDGDSSPASSTP